MHLSSIHRSVYPFSCYPSTHPPIYHLSMLSSIHYHPLTYLQLSIHPSTFCQALIYLSIHHYCLSIYQLITHSGIHHHLFICTHIYLSIDPSPSVHCHPSIHPSVIHMYISSHHPSIHPSIICHPFSSHLSIHSLNNLSLSLSLYHPSRYPFTHTILLYHSFHCFCLLCILQQ